ncbi:flagellar hook protein FlgE [Chitinimonas sp. JJ19]|uniref:flagellar hook protein FlgE n=1 Tax=Chitinimonas sp. JJ19 TaxID=3109352 RepID=UPI003003433D
MLDSIYIGISGLSSYSKGLKTISNNVTNLNTPGFKSSQTQFSDLFNQGGLGSHGHQRQGSGVSMLGTSVNFAAGEFRSTGNPMDIAIDGQGFFVLRDDNGNLSYTKAGQFQFNEDGVLISRTGGEKVMAFNAEGKLTEVTLDGLKSSPPAATANVAFAGNLSSVDTEHVINNVTVYDKAGGEHSLSMVFNNRVDNTTTGETTWTVAVKEGTNVLTTTTVKFKGGLPLAGSDAFNVDISSTTMGNSTVAFKLGTNVTHNSAGTNSELVIGSKDGYAMGTLVDQSFDEEGKIVLGYSNGQTSKPFQLALAHFDSLDALEQMGGNQFSVLKPDSVRYGVAGSGKEAIRTRAVEISNVDLSQEFSDLILNQRGYQASSQIVSTANEMIQQLFDMKRGG